MMSMEQSSASLFCIRTTAQKFLSRTLVYYNYIYNNKYIYYKRKILTTLVQKKSFWAVC